MHRKMLKFYLTMLNLASNEEGQDLIEYALVSTLIALSVVSSSKHIASAISSIFSNVSSSM
jgi:pilus assembly protein Flp/PilA